MSVVAFTSWITFDLVENLIKRSHGDNCLKLKTFAVNDAVGKADNFCSNIVRVSATFGHDSSISIERTQNFIVKSSLGGNEIDSISTEVGYFPKEINIYDEILPEVERLLLSLGDKTKFAPR